MEAKKLGLKMRNDSIFMEEDTRMSADVDLGSGSHMMKHDITDESRSSSTTDNNRNKRGRLEIAEVDT